MSAHFKFMQHIKFKYPKLGYGNNPTAVYRMVFDTGHFYVGSSKHVKTRFANWRTSIKNETFRSKIISDILRSVSCISFEIIEIIDSNNRFKTETQHILINKDNTMLLNRMLDAETNSNVKPLPTHLKRKKHVVTKFKSPHLRKTRKSYYKKVEGWIPLDKKVNQYTLNMEFIRTHNSIGAAARFMNVHPKTISEHLKAVYLRKGVCGFIFRYADNPTLLAKQSKKVKQRKFIKIGGSKPIIDMNTGVFYNSVKELSNLMDVKSKALYAMLSGATQNTTQYRYA